MTETIAPPQAKPIHHWIGGRVVAGPAANFLLAIVIFASLFTFFGKPSTSARVDKIETGSAAERAGCEGLSF